MEEKNFQQANEFVGYLVVLVLAMLDTLPAVST